MTMVTVQLASTQYTPRLLARFIADRATQRVLGTYLLTVVYLLLLLGAMGTQAKEEGPVPLPVLPLGVALGLTVLCLLLLPYFLHPAARSVEASNVIASIGREIIRELESLDMDEVQELSETLPGPVEEATVVAARETGYVQLVDMELKALSPAINDVTTAVMVVNELGAVGRAVASKGRLGQGWWRQHSGGVTLLRPGFGLVPFLQDALGEIPLAAATQPRVILRILEVLAEIASVEPDTGMRVMLVQTGRAVYEAARLAEQRERDVRFIEERWSQLQLKATQPGALPCETVH